VDNEGKPTEFVGNRTECALLMMLRGWNCDYAAIRHTWEDRLERVGEECDQKQV
jgi:Ca2+-transporting ATPase